MTIFFSLCLCGFKLKIPFWEDALKYNLPLFPNLAWANAVPCAITSDVKCRNEHDSAVMAVAPHACTAC